MRVVQPIDSIGRLVAENPRRASVFERHAIDYCCQGGRTLSEACDMRKLPWSEIVTELRAVDAEALPKDEIPWQEQSMADLTRHIEDTHHRYLRAELPSLKRRLERCVARHGDHMPALSAMAEVFEELTNELMPHMFKEEQVLFPAIRQMEQTKRRWTGCGGTVQNPIRVMIEEHRHAGDALSRLRELTGGYRPPEEACSTMLALYAGLLALEADLHLHIHKENNLLFPRALEFEQNCAV